MVDNEGLKRLTDLLKINNIEDDTYLKSDSHPPAKFV